MPKIQENDHNDKSTTILVDKRYETIVNKYIMANALCNRIIAVILNVTETEEECSVAVLMDTKKQKFGPTLKNLVYLSAVETQIKMKRDEDLYTGQQRSRKRMTSTLTGSGIWRIDHHTEASTVNKKKFKITKKNEELPTQVAENDTLKKDEVTDPAVYEQEITQGEILNDLAMRYCKYTDRENRTGPLMKCPMKENLTKTAIVKKMDH